MKRTVFFVGILLFIVVTLYAQDISLTVYNQDRALVRELRTLPVGKGITTLSYTDVASRIDPTSVHFNSVTAPDKLEILEQNYEYDIINANKIMQKYVDEDIRLVTEKGEIYEGKLLSASDDSIILSDDRGGIKVIRGKTVLHFDFPSLPEGLITRPTLIWMVNNDGPVKHKTELTYLTTGVNWHAEYVAVVGSKDEQLNLGGWVSLNNRSGATYKDAKLKLVAGDINLVGKRRSDRPTAQKMALEAAAPQFEEKTFFEYHMYTLQRKTTLKNNQTKQISLFPPADTRTEKIFLFDGARYQNKIRVNLEFINSKKSGLGIPLPKGKIRVYKEDTDGALEFIGEDRIDHTPSDEKVRIYLGNAFDLVGERIKKSSKKISARAREESYEISLRNHKKEEVKILVVEHLYGDWNITGKSHAFRKKDAGTAEFKITVPAKGETTLTYTVVWQW